MISVESEQSFYLLIIPLQLAQCVLTNTVTGGIEKFSAKENFRKTLKVSHFYLGFSSNKKP